MTNSKMSSKIPFSRPQSFGYVKLEDSRCALWLGILELMSNGKSRRYCELMRSNPRRWASRIVDCHACTAARNDEMFRFTQHDNLESLEVRFQSHILNNACDLKSRAQNHISDSKNPMFGHFPPPMKIFNRTISKIILHYRKWK